MSNPEVEARELIEDELEQVKIKRHSSVKNQIEEELSKFKEGLEKEASEYIKARVVKQRKVLEVKHGISNISRDLEEKRGDFVKGYCEGYVKVQRGDEITYSLISRYSSLGLNDPYNFGFAIGALSSYLDNRPLEIIRMQKLYLAVIASLNRENFTGYYDHIIRKARAIRVDRRTTDPSLLPELDYFMKKIS